MPGTKAGAEKARQTNFERYGRDFYKKIGSRSWKGKERSKNTGFALMTPEQRAELGRKGGLKTKDEYKPKYVTPEEFHKFVETQKLDADLSE